MVSVTQCLLPSCKADLTTYWQHFTCNMLAIIFLGYKGIYEGICDLSAKMI